MAPTICRPCQARVVVSACVAVLQTKVLMLPMVPPMLSCRVEAQLKAAAALCSVPPARVLQPKMMSLPMVLPMVLQPKMMSLLIVSRLAELLPTMMSLLMVLPMLRMQSRVEVEAAAAACAAARGVLEAVRQELEEQDLACQPLPSEMRGAPDV